MRANIIELSKLNHLFYVDTDYVLRHLNKKQGVIVDTKVGYINNQGYLSTEIKGKTYKVHRIIYQMTHNIEILESNLEVDHIDLNPLNNNPSNLRLCSSMENSRNRSLRRDSNSKCKGVSYDKKKDKWRARIRCNYKLISLGYYSIKEDAYKAYQIASKQYHGEYGRI
jgi:hypothetical protein